jgi:hypothetical protein
VGFERTPLDILDSLDINIENANLSSVLKCLDSGKTIM